MEKFVSASETPSQHQPPPPMMPPRPPLLKISTKTPRKPLLKSFNVAAQLPSDDDKVMEVTSTSAVPDMPQFKLKKGRKTGVVVRIASGGADGAEKENDRNALDQYFESDEEVEMPVVDGIVPMPLGECKENDLAQGGETRLFETINYSRTTRADSISNDTSVMALIGTNLTPETPISATPIPDCLTPTCTPIHIIQAAAHSLTLAANTEYRTPLKSALKKSHLSQNTPQFETKTLELEMSEGIVAPLINSTNDVPIASNIFETAHLPDTPSKLSIYSENAIEVDIDVKSTPTQFKPKAFDALLKATPPSPSSITKRHIQSSCLKSILVPSYHFDGDSVDRVGGEPPLEKEPNANNLSSALSDSQFLPAYDSHDAINLNSSEKFSETPPQHHEEANFDSVHPATPPQPESLENNFSPPQPSPTNYINSISLHQQPRLHSRRRNLLILDEAEDGDALDPNFPLTPKPPKLAQSPHALPDPPFSPIRNYVLQSPLERLPPSDPRRNPMLKKQTKLKRPTSTFLCSMKVAALDDTFLNESGFREEDESGEIVRRSQRMRYKPLEYWRNEHVVFGRRKSGPCPVPVIQKIVRFGDRSDDDENMEEDEELTSTRVKSSKKTKSSGGKRRRTDTQMDEHEGFEAIVDPLIPVICNDAGAEEHKELITNPRDIAYVATSDGYSLAKTLIEGVRSDNGVGVTCGFFKIPSDCCKPFRESGTCALSCFVVHGESLLVTIHKTTFQCSRGWSFLVPRGNVYRFENTGRVDVQVYFVRTDFGQEGGDGVVVQT